LVLTIVTVLLSKGSVNLILKGVGTDPVKTITYVTIHVIYSYLSDAASFCSRAQLGLPDNWSRVESWLSSEEKTVVKNVIFSEIVRKNPEIPVLNDYRIKAEKSFWVS
jgi:hypothetical protein